MASAEIADWLAANAATLGLLALVLVTIVGARDLRLGTPWDRFDSTPPRRRDLPAPRPYVASVRRGSRTARTETRGAWTADGEGAGVRTSPGPSTAPLPSAAAPLLSAPFAPDAPAPSSPLFPSLSHARASCSQ